jgi:pyruvate/2-oxoglutarate dehydrogenase complex dihydrolipoamide acyltransferase (E2) component
MDTSVAVLAVLGIFGALAGVALLPFRKRRRLGKWLFISGVVGIVTSIVIFALRADDFAKEAGFINAADERSAKEHGYSDAREWAPVRERLAQQKAEAAAEAAKQKAEAAAEAAKQKAEAAAEAAKRAAEEALGADSLSKIVDTYRQNEIRFKRDYVGKQFDDVLPFRSAKAKIFSEDQYTVGFGKGMFVSDIDCTVSDKATMDRVIDWNKGDRIRIRGVIKDVTMGSVQLDRCQLSEE